MPGRHRKSWSPLDPHQANIGARAIALFVLGAAIIVITGQSALRSGLRQVIFGVAAATTTFVVGRLVGTSLGV